MPVFQNYTNIHSYQHCLQNPRDGGVWWAAIYGVVHSQTQLKRLSSSSSTVCEFLLLYILADVWYFQNVATVVCVWCYAYAT